MAELPPEVQKDLQQLQTLSMQLQATQQQRLQFEAMLHETRAAVEALGGLADDAPIYRSLGALLVKEQDKAGALKRLEDEQETLELRVKRTKSQEDALTSSAQALQKKLQAALGG